MNEHEATMEDAEQLVIEHFGIETIENAQQEAYSQGFDVESVEAVIDALVVIQTEVGDWLAEWIDAFAYGDGTDLVAATDTETVFLESTDGSWYATAQHYKKNGNIPKDAFWAAERVHAQRVAKYGEDTSAMWPWVYIGDHREEAYEMLQQVPETDYSACTRQAVADLTAEMEGDT